MSAQADWSQQHLHWALKYFQKFIRPTGRGARFPTKLNLTEAKREYEGLSEEEKKEIGNRSWCALKIKWDRINHNFEPPHFQKLLRSTDIEIIEYSRILSLRGINTVEPSTPCNINEIEQYVAYTKCFSLYPVLEYTLNPLLSKAMADLMKTTYSAMNTALIVSDATILEKLPYLQIPGIIQIMKLLDVNINTNIFSAYLISLKKRINELSGDDAISDGVDNLDDVAISKMFSVFYISNDMMQQTAFQIIRIYTKYFRHPLIAEEGIKLLDNPQLSIDMEYIFDFLHREPRNNLMDAHILDTIHLYIYDESDQDILYKAATLLNKLCGATNLNGSECELMFNYLKFLLSINDPHLLCIVLGGFKRLFDGYYYDKIEEEDIEIIGCVLIDKVLDEQQDELENIINTSQGIDALRLDGYIREHEASLNIYSINASIPYVVNGIIKTYFERWSGKKPIQKKLNIIPRFCELLSIGIFWNEFLFKQISTINAILSSILKYSPFNKIYLSTIANKFLENKIIDRLLVMTKSEEYKSCFMKITVCMDRLIKLCSLDDIITNKIGPSFMRMIENMIKRGFEINVDIANSPRMHVSLKMIQSAYNHSDAHMISYCDGLLGYNAISIKTVYFLKQIKNQFINQY